MEHLTIEELDLMVDGLSALELTPSNMVDHMLLKLIPEDVREDPKYQEATAFRTAEARSKMESITLLKAKVISEKTRPQADIVMQGLEG